jgi:hypothetical protein
MQLVQIGKFLGVEFFPFAQIFREKDPSFYIQYIYGGIFKFLVLLSGL